MWVFVKVSPRQAPRLQASRGEGPAASPQSLHRPRRCPVSGWWRRERSERKGGPSRRQFKSSENSHEERSDEWAGVEGAALAPSGGTTKEGILKPTTRC